MRQVILHYHLFKNAGTSLDHILQENFQNQWVTREFDAERPNNTHRVKQWITDTPNAVAFSSHTMIGPLPQIENIDVVPIMMMRDPIERIVSAYHFERRQHAKTRGARLAKTHSLEGYVKARLAQPGDQQCRNFQTARLASMVPGCGSERARACAACDLIQKRGILGLVAEFDTAIGALKDKIAQTFPNFSIHQIRANASPAAAREPLTATLHQLLTDANADDFALLRHAQSRLQIT